VDDTGRDHLKIWLADLDPYIAQLEIRAKAAGFAGAIRTYSWDAEEFRRFAADAAQYPLAEARPSFVFGYPDTLEGQVLRESVRVEARSVGARGQLAVDVWIRASGPDIVASDNWSDDEFSVKLTIFTTHEQLGRFAAQLGKLAMGDAIAAELIGERLA
jgi:hypothetical protein